MGMIDRGAGRRRNAKPTGHEALRRLASVAVARNHFKALASYLAQGLDPNAVCYEGGRHEYRSLFETAAINDSLECFLSLSDAGSLATVSSTQFLFHPTGVGDDRRILRHLLATGVLDPFGNACPKFTCYEMACVSTDSTSLDIIQAAQAERERYDLQKNIRPATRASSPRARSI